MPYLGTEFVPRLKEAISLSSIRNLPSFSLSEALKVSTNIENAIKPVPEIKVIIGRTGRPDLATDPMGVYQTDVYVMLKPQSEWRRGLTKEKLVDELREIVMQQIPGHFQLFPIDCYACR